MTGKLGIVITPKGVTPAGANVSVTWYHPPHDREYSYSASMIHIFLRPGVYLSKIPPIVSTVHAYLPGTLVAVLLGLIGGKTPIVRCNLPASTVGELMNLESARFSQLLVETSDKTFSLQLQVCKSCA